MYYHIHMFNTKKQHSHTHTRVCVCNAGNVVSVPGLGRSPGGGCGNPLQYSCLENPMDGKAWWARLHRVAKSWTQLKQFSMHTHTYLHIHWKRKWLPTPVFLSGEFHGQWSLVGYPWTPRVGHYWVTNTHTYIYLYTCIHTFIYIYVYLNHFAIHLKLPQQWKVNIPQFKKLFKNGKYVIKKKKKNLKNHWVKLEADPTHYEAVLDSWLQTCERCGAAGLN